MDWFLYDNDLRHERVIKLETNFILICRIISTFVEIVIIVSTESFLTQNMSFIY